MKIVGIDFTSKPRGSKPITCLTAELGGTHLTVHCLEELSDFASFEQALREDGPWIAGIDFPFGQARQFIETIGWPGEWQAYVRRAQSLGRNGFREALNAYRATRPPGDKEHRRKTDIAAGSISPQKLYGVPVGLMFFEGAPRLIEAGVTVPGLIEGDPDRIVVEAYPGLVARRLIGRRSYKQDTKSKQTQDQLAARQEMLAFIASGAIAEDYGVTVTAPASLADDPGGDTLDALLCAIQAAWAWTERKTGYGAPGDLDSLEGWIADPALRKFRSGGGIN